MTNKHEPEYRRISGAEMGGERVLFHTDHLDIHDSTFNTGESALKHCHDIRATGCNFIGRYPIWHNRNVHVTGCDFGDDARAAMWYDENIALRNTVINAPKTLRECINVDLRNVRVTNGPETLWMCRDVNADGLVADGAEYIFMRSENLKIRGLKLHGKYSFQYARNIEIHDSELYTKDAFWHAENITVYDSLVSGEYLAWHSRNLRLVRCRITGTQPLCYCDNLIMEDCTMDADADLAFEYSTVTATINSDVTSVKNPTSGRIEVRGHIGETIIDEFCPDPAATVILSDR